MSKAVRKRNHLRLTTLCLWLTSNECEALWHLSESLNIFKRSKSKRAQWAISKVVIWVYSSTWWEAFRIEELQAFKQKSVNENSHCDIVSGKINDYIYHIMPLSCLIRWILVAWHCLRLTSCHCGWGAFDWIQPLTLILKVQYVILEKDAWFNFHGTFLWLIFFWTIVIITYFHYSCFHIEIFKHNTVFFKFATAPDQSFDL